MSDIKGAQTVRPRNVRVGDLLIIWGWGEKETDARPVTFVEKEWAMMGGQYVWRIGYTELGEDKCVTRFLEDWVDIIRPKVKVKRIRTKKAAVTT